MPLVSPKIRHFASFLSEPIVLAIISGILIGTSYIPYPAWAVAFCYIPLWWSVLSRAHQDEANQSQQSKIFYKKVFYWGWITQFILTLIGFNWLYYTATEFGSLPAPVSLLILLIFASLMHIYIPLALVIAVFIKRKFKISSIAFIFVIPLCHILMERFWPSVFEWNLGYTFLWMKWPLAQWADTFGFWGLSALVFVFQSVLLLALWFYKQNKLRNSIASLIFVTLAVALFWWTGALKYQSITQKLDTSVNIAIVQANVTNEEKLQSEKGRAYQGFVIQKYIDKTNEILGRRANPTDLVFWPETALPMALDSVFHNRPNQQLVINSVKSWNIQLITGAYSQDLFKLDHLGQNLIRNSVFFIGPQGETTKPYNKTDLLVFGEYMPFGQEFPFLYKILPFVGTYERGPGPVIKTIPLVDGRDSVRLGSQICYESLNPGFSRKLAQLDSQIIFNLTNDSWFGWWAEPYQHLIMTLARGVENRRPLIRSTNTGISSVILANGDELQRSPIGELWAGIYNVKYQKNPQITFYTQFGYLDWVLWLCLLCLIILRGSHARAQKS